METTQDSREGTFGDGAEFTQHRRETVGSVWPKQHFSNLFDCDPW